MKYFYLISCSVFKKQIQIHHDIFLKDYDSHFVFSWLHVLQSELNSISTQCLDDNFRLYPKIYLVNKTIWHFDGLIVRQEVEIEEKKAAEIDSTMSYL